KQLHYCSEYPVVTESTPIDVVTEEHEHRSRVLGGVPQVVLDLGEKVGLHDGRLEARIAAVQTAEHEEFVRLPGLRHPHVNVLSQERFGAHEGAEVLFALEAVSAEGSLFVELLGEAMDEGEVGSGLLDERRGVARVVDLEALEERVIQYARRDLLHGI